MLWPSSHLHLSDTVSIWDASMPAPRCGTICHRLSNHNFHPQTIHNHHCKVQRSKGHRHSFLSTSDTVTDGDKVCKHLQRLKLYTKSPSSLQLGATHATPLLSTAKPPHPGESLQHDRFPFLSWPRRAKRYTLMHICTYANMCAVRADAKHTVHASDGTHKAWLCKRAGDKRQLRTTSSH